MARAFVAANSDRITATPPVSSGQPLTLACWFNPSASWASQGCLFSLSVSTTSERVELIAGYNPNVLYVYANDNVTGDYDASTANFSLGTWQHAAAVFASATSRSIYLSGGNKATNTTNITVDTLNQLTLGFVRGNVNSYYYWGLMAEPAAWDVALTDDQIAELAKGYSPLMVQPENLVFYAPLRRGVYDVFGRALTDSGSDYAAHPGGIIYPAGVWTPPPLSAVANYVPNIMYDYRRRRVA